MFLLALILFSCDVNSEMMDSVRPSVRFNSLFTDHPSLHEKLICSSHLKNQIIKTPVIEKHPNKQDHSNYLVRLKKEIYISNLNFYGIDWIIEKGGRGITVPGICNPDAGIQIFWIKFSHVFPSCCELSLALSKLFLLLFIAY